MFVTTSFLLEGALKSTALLGVAWAAVLLFRRRSAALRHLVWSLAFASVLALPLLSLVLPALRVPVGGSVLTTGFVFETNVLRPASQPATKAGQDAAIMPELKAEPWMRWGMLLTIIWAAGTAISFAQMFIGLAGIERLRRRSNPLTMPGFDSMVKLLGIESKVDLLETEAGSMPITYGVFRPTLFMPADAAGWNAERRRVVLLHELAHVRRGDGATHLLARTALALYWWNPLAWAAWHEFLNERERAADDLVLNLGAGASDYAGHLLEIASSMQSPAEFGWAAVAMARRSQLEGRLLAILDPGRNRKVPRLVSTITACIAAMLIMAPVAALQAKSDAAQATVANQANAGPATVFLVKEADDARELGKMDQAKVLYQKALALSGNGPGAAAILIHLGTTELALKNFEQAIKDFERAQTADSTKTGEARMWMAITRQRENNLEAADALYQSALAAEDPHSVSALITMKLYGELLQQQGKQDEASTMQKEAARVSETQAAQAGLRNQSSGSDVYRIGGQVTAPLVVSKAEPEYTADARIAKYQGTSLLSVEIDADGSPRDIRVVRPLGFGLDEKAIEAVTKWRFRPATKDGQPVKVMAQIEVNFRLL